MKTFITTALIVFLTALIFFSVVKIPVQICLLLMVIAWVILLLKYRIGSNKSFYKKFVAGILGIISATATVQFDVLVDLLYTVDLTNCSTMYNTTWNIIKNDYSISILIFFLVLELVGTLIEGSKVSDKEDKQLNNGELYEEHKADLQRLKQYLEYTRILGIHSAWGNGKSFVVDYFCNEPETKEKYFIIKIESLAYKYDEFDRVLIDKLDALLRNQGILSVYSSEIKQSLEKSTWERLLYRFFRGYDANQTSALLGLKGELEKLSKKILIVFEDIERVNNAEAVKRIFAIAERLASEKIQVIYEYDADYLEKTLKVDNAYLEKYIPIEMQLTDLSYRTLVNYSWQELGMEKVNGNLVQYSPVKHIPTGVPKDVKKFILDFPYFLPTLILVKENTISINFGTHTITARKIQSFLLEIKAYLFSHKGEVINILDLRTVVGYFFIKIFMESTYQKLTPHQTLEQTFRFEDDGEMLTIGEIIQNLLKQVKNSHLQQNEISQQILNILEQEDNQESYSILRIFDYSVPDYLWREQGDENQAKPGTLYRIRDMEAKRERIDRIIWNLLQNGVSELSNSKACVEKFKQDVLSKNETQQHQALEGYFHDLYHENIYKDNLTVNRIGHPLLEDVANAMYLEKESGSLWQKFFALLKNERNNRPVDLSLINIMSDINLNDLQLYKDVLKYFNQLSSNCNFNAYEEYTYFLSKYVKRIYNFGYLSGSIMDTFIWSGNLYGKMLERQDVRDEVCQNLEQLIEQLRKSRLLHIEEYQRDISLLIVFLQKNEAIIKNSVAYKRPGPSVKWSSVPMKFTHQEFVDQLRLQLRKNNFSTEIKPKIIEQINEAYKTGDIYPIEIQVLRNEMKTGKISISTRQELTVDQEKGRKGQ